MYDKLGRGDLHPCLNHVGRRLQLVLDSRLLYLTFSQCASWLHQSPRPCTKSLFLHGSPSFRNLDIEIRSGGQVALTEGLVNNENGSILAISCVGRGFNATEPSSEMDGTFRENASADQEKLD